MSIQLKYKNFNSSISIIFLFTHPLPTPLWLCYHESCFSHKEIFIAPSANKTNYFVQQGNVFYGVLDCTTTTLPAQ